MGGDIYAKPTGLRGAMEICPNLQAQQRQGAYLPNKKYRTGPATNGEHLIAERQMVPCGCTPALPKDIDEYLRSGQQYPREKGMYSLPDALTPP